MPNLFAEGNFEGLIDPSGAYPAPDAFYEDPRYLEIIENSPARVRYRLLEGARAQGQWEPLTPEELGDLTN